MHPTARDIEVPLLQALVEIGGQSKAQSIYPLVAKRFPQVREEDLAGTISSGSNRRINRIQWTRQGLAYKGEMDSLVPGIWRTTPRGRARIAGSTQPLIVTPPPSLP